MKASEVQVGDIFISNFGTEKDVTKVETDGETTRFTVEHPERSPMTTLPLPADYEVNVKKRINNL